MNTFVMGNRYRIHYRIHGVHNAPRRIVADFMYEEDGSIYLSGRPSFGTTKIDNDWVIEALEVPKTEAIERPTVVRS